MTNPIARPPGPLEVGTDRAFRSLTSLVAALTALLVLLIVLRIGWTAWPAVRQHGLGFLVTSEWDPNKEHFGVWPQIAGTLYSSLPGLGLGTLFGLATAIVLSQDFLPPKLEAVLASIVQLLAAIPSVVYGL